MQKLSSISIIAITVSAIVGLRTLPLMASGGLSSLSLALLAILVFLIPSTYVCAKLASHCDIPGGIYQWVKQAFGQRVGFMSIWLEWINNVVSFPATLASIIGMLFLILKYSPLSPYAYTAWMLILLWAALAYNLWPIAISSILNLIACIGTFFIALLIIGLGALWIWQSPHDVQPLAHFQHTHLLSELAVFISFIGAYSGMQITAFHSQDTNNIKQFKWTLPISAFIIAFVTLGASSMMALLIPSSTLNIVTGVQQMIGVFFEHFSLPHLGILVSACMILTMLASFSSWLIGPARGMQTALADAGVKHYLARLNKNGMPKGVLFIQGIITSALIACFLISPSIKTTFWLMVAITSQFTALMYVLVFAAALKLIAKTWFARVLCLLGLLSCLIGFCVGVFMPSALEMVSYYQYTFLVLGGDAVIIVVGLWFSSYLNNHKKFR